MSSVFIEPHYLPNIEYFTVIAQTESVYLDIEAPFKKQTYRNRMTILGPNGSQSLVVPVHYSSRSCFKDVKIDYTQTWVKDHWGAFYSAYGKSPFFDHFADSFQSVWSGKPIFLLDLNMEMLSVCLRILQWQNVTVHLEPKNAFNDLRDMILPKKSFDDRSFYRPIPYLQNFGKTFVPNLSILDLLLCQGPEASSVIRDSIAGSIERFDS